MKKEKCVWSDSETEEGRYKGKREDDMKRKRTGV